MRRSRGRIGAASCTHTAVDDASATVCDTGDVCQVGSCAAGACVGKPTTIGLYTQTTYAKKGTVYVCAYIDPLNTVREWSEGDNIVCVSMTYNESGLETRPENAASHFLAESLVCCLGG